MEKVRPPRYGQPSDRGRLKNKTEHTGVLGLSLEGIGLESQILGLVLKSLLSA